MHSWSLLKNICRGEEILLWPFVILLFGWIMLALFGFFTPLCTGGLLVICLSIWICAVWQKRTSLLVYLPVVILGGILVTFAFSTHPLELVAGRDQGSYAEAAFRLAENHSLFFSSPGVLTFFEHYGPGKALNFPGFYYTQSGALVSQFSVGYIAWLAGCIALIGSAGSILANGTLFLISLCLLFGFLKKNTSSWFAWFGVGLFGFHFLPLWFVSFTLSENLALALFLMIITTASRFYSQPSLSRYLLLLALGGLFACVRIEGWVLLLLIFTFLALHPYTRGQLWRHQFLGSFVLPGATLFLLTLALFWINTPYFTTIGKALFRFLEQDPTLSSNTPLEYGLWGQFALYGLAGLFITGALAMVYLSIRRQWLALLPLFFAFPTLLYLVDPNITFDPPWMLRRYLFTLFPLCIILLVSGLSYWYKHTRLSQRSALSVVISTGLILFGLQIPGLWFYHSSRFLPDVPESASELSQVFSSNDLILLDSAVTGDGYHMLTAPLATTFHLHAVYFFNPSDLDTLATEPFEHIYLIIPQNKVSAYATLVQKSENVGTFNYTHTHLLSFDRTGYWLTFPSIETRTIENTLYKIR